MTRIPNADAAHRFGETALLSAALLLPLAYFPRAFEPAVLKLVVLQWCALSLAAAWLWQGVSRGRFSLPASSWSAVLPALACALWTIGRFAASPSKLAVLPEALTELSLVATYLAALLGFGGARTASRFAGLFLVGAALAAAASFVTPFVSRGLAVRLLIVGAPLAIALSRDPETSPAARWACRAFAAAVLAALGALAVAGGPSPLTASPGGLVILLLPAFWKAVSGAQLLRQAGARAESEYARGFAVAAVASLVCASQEPSLAAAGWLAWPLAGLAAGLAPLAERRARVSVFPLPISEDVRRAFYAPGLLVFGLLALPPGLWLRSESEHNAAILLARQNRLDEAAERFASVLPGAPSYPASLYYRGAVRFAQDRPEEALAALDRLQHIAPDFGRVHALRGAALTRLMRFPEAVAEHSRHAELDPSDVANLAGWSEAARASGDLEQARIAAARAEALSPNDPAVIAQLSANELMARRLTKGSGTRFTSSRPKKSDRRRRN